MFRGGWYFAELFLKNNLLMYCILVNCFSELFVEECVLVNNFVEDSELINYFAMDSVLVICFVERIVLVKRFVEDCILVNRS